MSPIYLERATVRLSQRPPDPLGRQPWAIAVGLRMSTGQTGRSAGLLPLPLWPLAPRADVERRLRDSITEALGHQPLEIFNSAADRLDDAGEPLLAQPAVRLVVEQALLDGFSSVACHSSERHLVQALGLAPPPSGGPKVVAEVPDFAATAALFDDLIPIRPDGIGYRLTAEELAGFVGPDALELQRFARELSERTRTLVSDQSYNPVIYLALNGALGQLTPDPRLHYGRILGPLVGLERAVAPFRLVVEDPLRLDDPIQQAAAMSQLNEAARFRKLSVELAVREGVTNLTELDLCLSARSAGVVALEPTGWGRIGDLLEAMRRVIEAGCRPVLLCDGSQPWPHVRSVAGFAWAAGASVHFRLAAGNLQALADLMAESFDDD